MNKASKLLARTLKTGQPGKLTKQETAQVHREFASDFRTSIDEIRDRQAKQRSVNFHNIIVD